MKVTPLGPCLGARIDGLDLAATPGEEAFAALEEAFDRYGVVAVSDQRLDEPALIAFSRRLGELEINVASSFRHPEHAHVNILSNKRKADGTLIGAPDAGEGWHTDMSYNATPARASILYALEVPMRDGRPIGDTLFASMTAAYDALPPALQTRLEGLEAVHHFAKFYDYMIRERGSPRRPLTPAERAARPPIVHPMVVRHPHTGRKCLYADPGYSVEVVGLAPEESRELLEFLFAFQTQEAFQYRHKWRQGDVLMWDNISTIHMATGGYAADEPRLMWRTQVLGDPVKYLAANPPHSSRPD